MKILFYNWVDYLDDENRGGGVSVYQHNLIHALDDEGNNDCYFLSSGISYDMFSTAPRSARVKHGENEGRKRRFEIINSGVLAPAHHSFSQNTQLEHPETTEVFFDFIRKHGPFDVVHFNNLEGLPAEVLTLKEHWPETRVVFSLHNYYPVCPQVNLWHKERENCLDFDGGRKCELCLPHQHDDRIIRLANAVAFNLKKRGIRPGSKLFDRGFSPSMRVAGRLVRIYQRRFARAKPEAGTALLQQVEAGHHKFARRRARMVELINSHCDTVLCVSDRVAEVARRFGIAPALLQTSYIGTRHAEKFQLTSPTASITKPDGTLTLAYLGYMRHDKGFFFLLDALKALPKTSAKRVNVVIASRLIDQPTMQLIMQLSDTLASVQFADGYSHDQLDDLLADVDLGLVPVLWEDNLPQVAIEMHARHIPLLTSDLGGAQELGNCPDLVFSAGDVKDFARKIANILKGKVDIETYWQGAMAPHSMADHLSELHPVYDASARAIKLLPSAPPPPVAVAKPVASRSRKTVKSASAT